MAHAETNIREALRLARFYAMQAAYADEAGERTAFVVNHMLTMRYATNAMTCVKLAQDMAFVMRCSSAVDLVTHHEDANELFETAHQAVLDCL